MSDGKYEVGFAKPPKKSRFKKGQSGNPGGRPKGSKSVKGVLESALSERVVVVENGERRSISKLEAAVKQLVNKAASGNERFMRQLLNLLAVVEEPAPPEEETNALMSAADREILAAILARMAEVAGANDDHTP
jgi:hypothetical protein